MAHLLPIYCVTCGRPTGNVIDQDKWETLTPDQQTCSDCLGFHPNPGAPGAPDLYACPHCGETTFAIREDCTRYPYGSIRRNAAGLLIATADDWDDVETIHENYPGYVECTNCHREMTVDAFG